MRNFSSKDPDETYPVSYGFAAHLATGETISTATVTATIVSSGASASSILSGSPQISGSTVTQLVTAGTSGVTYKLTFRVTTSDSNIYEVSAKLPVKSS